MPPGDTLIERLPDSIRSIVDSLVKAEMDRQAIQGKAPRYPFPEWIMFLLLLTIIAISAYSYIIRPAEAKRKRTRRIMDDVEGNAVLSIQYDEWLGRYNPYYASLPPELKKRFLKRVIEFKEAKQFRYHFMEPDELCSVLISGAAVQLTFGLKRFLIEYFPVINILKSEYSVIGRDKVLEGHVRVDNHSINISWNNFLADYEDYTDSENVGLHEMAHAISFDFLYGHQENKNAFFNARFREYVTEANPVYKDLRLGKNDMLDDYGCLNVEEFWAVSIETFFENPQLFKDRMPALYASIANVLNQDPLRPEKIIDIRRAGL